MVYLVHISFLIFSITASEELHQTPTHIQTSSLLSLTKPSLLPPTVQILWYHPVNLANIPQSGLNAYLLFCSRFNSTPTPALSLTLLYFCVDKSQSIYYKTLEVCLAVIRLMYIENGLTDPTTDESLHLVCRGIRQPATEQFRTCKAADSNQLFENPQISVAFFSDVIA